MKKKLYAAALVVSLAFAALPPGARAATGDQHGHDQHGHAGHQQAAARRAPRRATSKSRRASKQRKKARARAAGYYSCSMHPDVRSATPGTCPKCGMELARKRRGGGDD